MECEEAGLGQAPKLSSISLSLTSGFRRVIS